MVVSTLRLFPSREQHHDVLDILRSVQLPTQTQPCCVGCQLFEEDGYERAILYMEQWDGEQELHRHISSDLYNRVLEAAELSRRPPEFKFHFVHETRGLDLIEAIRRQPAATGTT